jgi:hypothetical protein
MQQTDPAQIKDLIFQILRKGYTPVIAHPERYHYLIPKQPPAGMLKRLFGRKQQPDTATSGLLSDLQQQGCLLQQNRMPNGFNAPICTVSGAVMPITPKLPPVSCLNSFVKYRLVFRFIKPSLSVVLYTTLVWCPLLMKHYI